MGTESTSSHVGTSTSPLVVLGWDAATWDLLTPWVEQGKLPHLASLMQNGSYGAIRSTSLPVSPAAWSTIITGKNPGKHGVFDWFARKPDSYDVEYVHTGQIKARPVWEYFNQGGQRIGVFNLPMLYPAVPLEGFMLSGLAAPDAAEGFAYPPELLDELSARLGSPYRHAEDEIYKYGREAAYLQSILDLLDHQRRALRYLIEQHPCDAYLLVFMQTDHAQHKFWRYLDPTYPGYDAAHDLPFSDAIEQVFRGVDDFLGELLALFGSNANFMVLSDHGGGPVHGIMYINRWLQEIGMLHLKRDLSTRLKIGLAKTDLIGRAYRLVSKLGLGGIANLVSKPARNKVVNSFIGFDNIDWTRTKAYARGAFGQIFVNVKGREPQGIISPGAEYADVVTELIAALEALPHPESGERNEPLITDLRRREDSYQGDYLEQAADVMFSIQGYLYQSSVKMGFDNPGILGQSEYEDSGSHRPEGIVVLSGPDIRRGATLKQAQVSDILPTMLALAGLPIPDDLDGRPLEETFTDEQRQRIQVVPAKELNPPTAASPDLAGADLATVEERLRGLGYLG